MFSKCVNPFCNRPYEQESHGKAFVVQFPKRPLDHLARRVTGRESFWLCDECSRLMSVAVRREFDTISVRIINQSPGREGKLKRLEESLAQTSQDSKINIHRLPA